MSDVLTKTISAQSATPNEENVPRIGRSMARMRLMTGRRLIGRLAIQSAAPGLELSHLDVLDAVRRAQPAGEVTVGMIAEMLRIDPSRASRVVADMVGRNVLRREASQADARRIVVVMTEVGQALLAEIVAQKLAIISEIVADWPQEDIDRFAILFERFIGGYEAVFLSRDKDTPG
ncbi:MULTISPECIES: MarR family winged helix-turn-helix transcriptional regulator [Rhizobium]|jgi:DNA-binding MarR family transcriptional regulator|uniref:MarR family transcriptional regulator n=1 Tax=Rhizobium anhuiense TaxID=1184720 RepID=A0A3S0QKV2_9HYPH|nr:MULTISPECIES: MarR family winged helix-turn-helix transcriptional regulator [Rhizobium]KZS55672.1 MarR family transcriptional regulator [Rhizobium anhuiense bv. trifolii]MBB3301298.1 DNA-binding MarR family transcriptional regulator [Rhizobium sp. BK112]MBB3370420.1 DNA-binding MarR family transcriptional regulator [Rhizobium sp. BK077]MBB3745261.1 DNA-binding MarR family transcriptional regulator [Rhizobium sp. BK591]MBB4114692.1 DNA-binding MarR family transcriptional regulator [Rhizobium